MGSKPEQTVEGMTIKRQMMSKSDFPKTKEDRVKVALVNIIIVSVKVVIATAFFYQIK